MPHRDIPGSRALVTGASSGIGYALALELARQGADVVITARREDRLAQLATEIRALGRRAEIVPGDITDQSVRRRAVEAAATQLGGLDILVNNAGVGVVRRFCDSDEEKLRRVMEVNFFALVEMTREALPLLRQSPRRPIVVNVSSILGRRAVPFGSEYSASKFAVHGFSESIRAELAREQIDVLVVSPGTTETEFFDSVMEKSGGPNWPEHRGVPARYVALQTIKALRRGRHEITPYFWGKILVLLNRLSPSLVDRLMARYA